MLERISPSLEECWFKQVPPEFDLGIDEFVDHDTFEPPRSKRCLQGKENNAFEPPRSNLRLHGKENASIRRKQTLWRRFQRSWARIISVTCPKPFVKNTPKKKITTGDTITCSCGFLVGTTTFLKLDVLRTSWTKLPGKWKHFLIGYLAMWVRRGRQMGQSNLRVAFMGYLQACFDTCDQLILAALISWTHLMFYFVSCILPLMPLFERGSLSSHNLGPMM